MKLFRKPIPPPVGRRRPPSDADASPSSNAAFSYHAQRSMSPENTGRRDAEALAVARNPAPASFWVRHRTTSIALLVLALAVAGYMLYLSPQSRVVLLTDETTSYFLQPDTVYTAAANQSLRGSIFNQNKLTIDTNKLRFNLLQSYPEIKNVTVAMPFVGHQPQVYIEPYKPSFILTTTASNAFLLDETGRALASTSQITNVDKLDVPTLEDRSGLAVKLGTRSLPSTTVRFTQTVVAALKAAQVTPGKLALVSAYELDVTASGEGYYTKFNLQNDALQQAGTYLATRQRLATDHVTPGQYIDVRVPGRAYYK